MEEAGEKIEGGEESPFHGVNETSVSTGISNKTTPEYRYDDNSRFDDLLHGIVGINYMTDMFYDLIQGEQRVE